MSNRPDEPEVKEDVPATETPVQTQGEAVKAVEAKPKRKRPVKPVLRPGAKKAPKAKPAKAAKPKPAAKRARKPKAAPAAKVKATKAKARPKAATKAVKAPAKATKSPAGTAAAKRIDVSAKVPGPGVPNAGPAMEAGVAAFGNNRRALARWLRMAEQNVGRVLRVHRNGFAMRVPAKFVPQLAAIAGVRPADIDPEAYLPQWTVPRYKPGKAA